jgi:signal transduction histidine kinase
MGRFEKLSWFIPQGVVKKYLITPKSRSLFFQEIDFVNFQRLRTIVIFSIFFSISMLIIDFASFNIWSSNTIKRFVFLDLSFSIFLLISLVFIQWNYPKNKKDVKPLHHLIYKTTLIACIIWISLISASESTSANSLPTFIIGIFVLSTVFFHRARFLIILLLFGLVTLLGSLLNDSFSITKIIQIYFSSAFLVIIAFITSRLLYTTNIKAFAANLNLENNNALLDDLVKMRTLELSTINERLKFEIIAREKYEIQLKKQKEQAEEADRLKSSFLANMSHEIRTPLNGIVGFSDLLQVPNLSFEKKERYSSIIKKNSTQLIKIIDDIIDISMIESNQLKYSFSKFTSNILLDPIIDFFKAYIQSNNLKTIEFLVINLIPDKRLEINSDPLRIQQVINNLVSNAFKFTPEGYIKLTIRQDSDELLFIVEDTGIGIAPEKSEIIFERFRQIDDSLNRSYGGTGLGLSISAGIVNTLGGNIWLDYSYAKGSRFCFTLPIDRQPLKNSTTDKRGISKKLCDKKTILVITNSDKYFAFLKQLFKSGDIIRLRENEPILLSKLPNVIITTPVNDLNFYEKHLKKILEASNGIKVFSIVENDDEKEKAEFSGSHYIYQNPLNSNKLAADINKVFTQQG